MRGKNEQEEHPYNATSRTASKLTEYTLRYGILMHACKALMSTVSCLVARHQLETSQQHYPSYFLSLFTMNVANQLYHPYEYKAIAKMCEKRITHTELDMHQSNIKIDFLLLSMTFLPVGVAYKTTDNQGFI